jgi:peptidoglycan/LPS O-acetylase OafA/YrhL
MSVDAPRATAARVGSLDGLRALAVAAVFAFHLDWIGGGWLGVDTFFTLSGFLITSLLLAEVGREGGLGLRRFWRRRIRRLQPASLVCIAAVVATASWWSPAGTGTAVRRESLSALFSIENWYMLWENRPYAAGGSPSAFEHFWSLAIEEQFYVLWPLAIALIVGLVARHRARATVFGVAVIATLASWTLLALVDLQRGYLGTDTRIGSILAGAALACVLPLGHEREIRHASAIGWVGLAGIAATWLIAGWEPRIHLALLLPMHALFTVAAIIGISAGGLRALSWKPLATIGLVSYGIYLWHWPVIVIFTPDRLGQSRAVTDAFRIALTAVLATGSWFLLERPVRKEHILRVTKLAFPIAVVAVMAIAFAGSAAIEPPPVFATARGKLVQTNNRVAVEKRPAHAPQRVLVVGDSIPTSLLSGTDATGQSLLIGSGRLLEQFASTGITASAATITGCPVVDETIVAPAGDRAYCRDLLKEILPPAMSKAKPDLVLWYSLAEAYPVKDDAGVERDPVKDPAAAAALRKRFADRIAWFRERGAQVVLVSPGPARDGENDMDPRHDSLTSMRFLDDTLQQVAREHQDDVVDVIEMSDLVCPDWRTTNSCPDTKPGGGFYRGDDGEHFDGRAAVEAGQWLVDRIKALRVTP